MPDQNVAPNSSVEERLSALEHQYVLLSQRQELLTTSIGSIERQIELLQTQIDKLVELIERVVPERDDS